MTHFNALPPDTILENKYRVLRVLGTPGGFGIAYLAIDAALNKKVVIKEFLPSDIAYREGNSVQAQTSNDKENLEWGLAKFKEEAQTLVRFNHHNIVKVLTYFEENNTAYFVMDYEEGQDLSDYVASQSANLSEAEILQIMMPILDGLREVHRHHFLHRDIKPGNIYIRDDSSPMLIDFGAARNALGVKSKSITQILTPGYAPTEQYGARTSKQGVFSDIYSIGAVLYQLITNKTPIPAPDRSKAVYEDDEADPLVPAVVQGQGNYSKQFLEAIDWALSIRAKDRPQTVRTLQNRLMNKEQTPPPEKAEEQIARPTKKIAEATKEQIAEPTQPPKPTKTATLNPIVLSVLAVVGVIVLGVLGNHYWQTREQIIGLTSTPSDVSVYLDNRYQGTTPVDIAVAYGDDHSLALKIVGYETKTQTINAASTPSSLDFVLNKKIQTIRLTSTPSGALVYLDNRYQGYTPIDITVAYGDNHSLALKKAGYIPKSQTINAASTPSSLDLVFEGLVIDGIVYQTVRIGNQEWMASNLNLEVGDGSWCYDNSTANCNKYGRLYRWEAAKRAVAQVPGWHLPTDAEWQQMEISLGMHQSAAIADGGRGNISNALKSTYGWSYNGRSGNGNNSSGFNALPTGRYHNGYFYDVGSYAGFWTATTYSGSPWRRSLSANYSEVYRNYDATDYGFAVRLIRD